MSHLTPLVWTLAPSLLASVAGAAVAIGGGILAARRAGKTPIRSPAAWFVTAALFAAMTGAMVYQGVSERFPPAFVGAAVFLVGVVIALRSGLRRAQA
jgi:hypothetical protein